MGFISSPPPPSTHYNCVQASFNRLSSLPSELALLPNLELMRVACCNLTALPPALSASQRLAWISTAGNPMCRDPPRGASVHAIDAARLVMGRKLGELGHFVLGEGQCRKMV
jgi:hypothetical protein